jgi:hypothetical protein
MRPVTPAGVRRTSAAKQRWSLLWALAAALACSLAWPAAVTAGAPPAPTLDGEAEEESTNGAFLLAWKPDEDAALDEAGGQSWEYELEEAPSPDFANTEVVYCGAFDSWFVSGRRDGAAHFRVRARALTDGDEPGPWSEWSAPKTIVIAHHDLRLALGLAGLGALVFAATAITLVVGARRRTRAQTG